MALYANFVPNPSFELATTNWTSEASGTVARIGSNAFSGTYSMRIQLSASDNVWGGVQTTVPITPGASQAHTLSLYISGATENHGASYNAGVRVTVYDLLPGQSTRNQLARQTFSRTTNGRVAIRNFIPRATADRIVITVETASTFFQAQQSSTQTSGFVWTTISQSAQTTGGITSPAGTYIDPSVWNNYANTGYTLSGQSDFLYRENITEIRYNARSGTWNKTTVTQPEIRGGTSTVYVDAVQLEQATIESAYVDGTKPGYVWAGAAHNSATLNMVPLEATGTSALTGPNVEVLVLGFLQSGGQLNLTGAAEMTAEGTVRASGDLMSLLGTVAVWSNGAMKASGASSMVGSAVLATMVQIEAHGTMGPGTGPATPSAAIRLAWDAGGATGDMTMSGGVEITFPQPISASGDMTMGGTGRAEIGWQLISSGALTMSGIAQLDDAIPAGAFEDFVIYSAAVDDTDPLMLGRGGGNAGTSSGANGAAWNRVWSEFYAPANEPVSGGGYAWRRAAYAAVGFKFTGVPASNYQELSCVQLEVSSADTSPGPRTYRTAKTIRPMVWADRINYSVGDLWTFFGSVGITVTNGGASPILNDPNPIRNFNFTSTTPTGFFGGNVITPPLGMWCVASVYLKGDGNIPSMRMRVLGANLAPLAVSEYIPLPAGEWVRIEVPFQATVADHVLSLDLPEDILAVPAVVQAAAPMVEHGTRAGEYLGFVAGTTDYYYRYNGSDPTKGIFLYQDIGERIPLLSSALDAHAQLAVRVAEPEFGLVPSLD